MCPVKIDIPTILIHLRARSVDVKRRLVPDVWDVAMNVSALVMSKSSLWAAASETVKASALLGGKEGKIGALPFPASLWTGARDLPVAPSETFRQWWKRTHPDGQTPVSGAAGSRADRSHNAGDGFPADPPPPPGEPVTGSASADGEPAPAALDARSAIINPEPIHPGQVAPEAASDPASGSAVDSAAGVAGSTSEEEL